LERTFIFEDEGHTLGSILTYILESFSETSFCAYSIRHPSENKIYVRLKVKDGNSVEDIFKRGIQELNEMLNHVKKTFQVCKTLNYYIAIVLFNNIIYTYFLESSFDI